MIDFIAVVMSELAPTLGDLHTSAMGGSSAA
jgi:hypothetical protein